MDSIPSNTMTSRRPQPRPVLYAAVLALASVSAAIQDTEMESVESVEDVVLGNPDLLNLILNQMPLQNRRMFNTASRDLIRSGRLLDPALPAHLYPDAIRALIPNQAPFSYHAEIRQSSPSLTIDWSEAVHITNQLFECGRPIQEIVELAHILVETEKDVLKIVREALDLTLVAQDELVSTFPVFEHDPSEPFQNGDIEIISEWRQNPPRLMNSPEIGSVYKALYRKLSHQKPILPESFADVRLFFKHFSYPNAAYNFSLLQTLELSKQFCCYVPEPFSYIITNIHMTSLNVLHRLPQSRLRDPRILLSLRCIGIIFDISDYVNKVDQYDLNQVVPFLDKKSVIAALIMLVNRGRLADVETLSKMPEIVAIVNDRYRNIPVCLSAVISYGETDLFRVLMMFERIRNCVLLQLEDDKSGNLLHVAAQYDRPEIAEILLPYEPRFANQLDQVGFVPLRHVRDPQSDIYRTIESFTDEQWRGQYEIPAHYASDTQQYSVEFEIEL